MALNATEQLRLMSGEIKPPSNTLDVLVHQSAFMYSKTFYDTYKDFPETDNTDPLNPVSINIEATSYRNKMRASVNRTITNRGDNIATLTRVITTIIGASTAPVITIAALQGATDVDWSNFIFNNMEKAIEYISDVKRSEKTAYNDIVI